METYKGKVLDKFQKESLKYIQEGASVLISAPTGSGKTLLAEYAIETALQKRNGIIYTAPIKALSNQKYRDFCLLYPDKTGIVTGDVSINSAAPITIMTTEIFRNIIVENPRRVADKEWVIFDEIHYLDDIERGTVWEEALIFLPPHLKILALSATVSNLPEIAAWLRKIHPHPLKVVKETKRPVPLRFYFQFNNKIFLNWKQLRHHHNLYLKKKNRTVYNYKPYSPNRLSTLFKYLYERDKLPCIYFSFSRRKCEIFAEELYNYDFLNAQEKKYAIDYYNRLLKIFGLEGNPTAEYLKSLIERGIAFHHAGLLPSTKEILERLFTLKLIKAMFTTETFALGINMPARTVIFDSLQKYYGHWWRSLKTRDFYQMAGRAGRRGIDKEGYVFLKINPSLKINEVERIIHSAPEKIKSQFKNNYATILNLYSYWQEEIYSIYPSSFHAWQAKEKDRKEALRMLKEKVSLLKYFGYINQDNQLSTKGKLAAKLYNFELIIGEVYSKGLLESLSPLQLCIFAAALAYEPRRGEKEPALSPKTNEIRKTLASYLKTIHKEEKYRRIYPLSKRPYFHLSESIQKWFEGTDFIQLSKHTTIDEGTLVRYLRMSIQILREIKEFPFFRGDFYPKVEMALKRINRDLVNAEEELKHNLS